MRLRNSFWALLGRSREVAPHGLIEDVRHAMLAALDLFCGSAYLDLDDRISNARDLDALWYLRSPLMIAIAENHGEALARDQMLEITKMFAGFQPGAD